MASSSADPSPADAGSASSKHAWSQIVRCKDATASVKKLSSQVPNADQIQSLPRQPRTNQAPMAAEAGIIPAESTLDMEAACVADARVFCEASVRGEETVEGSKFAGDGNVVTPDVAEVAQSKALETSHGDAGDARVSKPPWRKPAAAAEGEANPQPVMGATAWPALTDARNMKKTPEIRKSKASPLKDPQMSPTTSIQESLSKVSLHSGDVSNLQQGVKNKPPFKGSSVGIGRPAFQPIENGASFSEHPALGARGPSEPPSKHSTHARMKGNFSANPSMDTDRVYHHRNDGGGPFHNYNRKWRNNYRDQGRGWHQYVRAHENACDMVSLLHEQRIGPRNMPRPHPYMNMNPGFYTMPQFQNNGMFYIPPVAPEFVHGPPYYHIAPPGGAVSSDLYALHCSLIKQVDYYFSVENLCRDVFLRTHMDAEGFVAVSVIAQFNRIRSLSSNPQVILEALQYSTVVEVQHDKIRRRNDRGKWRLMQDQVYAVNSRPLDASVRHSFQEESGRFHDSGLVSSDDTKNGSGNEHAWASFDRLNSIGDCKVIEDQRKRHNADDIKVSGTDGFTHLFQRDSTNQETCTSPARILEERARDSQAAKDGNPVCWSGSDVIWMENSPYLRHSALEKNDTQARESDFMLKVRKDVDEQPEDGSDRELDRPMKVSHASLGSYIAVP